MIRIRSALENTYATVFVYFECMLIGAMICGVRAAGFHPARDKDFILILGCWFRNDGTLPPLLRGRADKALDFWRRQKEETGREAWMIASGGQGKDEPVPEAEAIRRYHAEHGFFPGSDPGKEPGRQDGVCHIRLSCVPQRDLGQ